MGALARDITAGGTSAMSAQAINGRVATGLTAAGTAITDALDLNATINVVSTVAASTGVQLYSMLIGDEMEVYNAGANALKVYPDSTSVAINQLSAGSAMSLPVNTGCKYRKVSATQIVAYMSA